MHVSIHDRLAARWLNASIRIKGAAIVAIPVAALLLQLLWFARLLHEEELSSARALQTQRVQVTDQRVLDALTDIETGARGYALTRTESFLEPYQNGLDRLPQLLRQLQELVQDPEQRQKLQRVGESAQKEMEAAQSLVRAVRKPGDRPDREEQQKLLALQGKQAMDSVRQVIAEFDQRNRKNQQDDAGNLERQRRMSSLLLWLAALVGVTGGFLAVWLISRGIGGRLALLAGDAGKLANGWQPPPPGSTQDEIGKLERALYSAYGLANQRAHELQASEQEIRARNAALEAANQELEAFSYSVSHDLRAPLRHIDGFTRILLEDHAASLPAEAQRLLERVRGGATQMGRLIEELLNLGRISRKDLQLQITGLGGLVSEVRAEVEAAEPGRRREWRIGELPFVECDPVLLRQVFLNLLSNAVKYSRSRGLAVIEVGERAQGGERAIFVRDNGVGFSMKYADKLFGIFQRLHRQEDFEGTGVGLATAARIIQRHGGRIWAEAELDRGATFYFTLAGMNPSRAGHEMPAAASAN